MATAIKYAQIQSSSLDFDAIKDSLKTYLQSQDIFQDYNFQGSSMNILLDVLASNTHYYALYNSMIANEMFLDTAILRSNVISNAKNLGYIPRSNIASSTSIKLQIDAKTSGGVPLDLGKYITVPKGTVFNSSVDGTQYKFCTMAETVLTLVSPGSYANPDITIKEGTVLRKSFTVTGDPSQTFQILDSNIDTTTVKVWVQQSVSNLEVAEYTPITSIIGLSSSDSIFIVQESADGNYELKFGDNIIGKKPIAGNIITVEYLSTTAGQADGCNVFSLVALILDGQTHTVTANKQSSGASIKESIESIKLHARYNFEAQGRAVVPADYKTTIMKLFPDILDVNVWGGEDNDPPEYGRVFIAPLSNHLTKITTTKKDEIVSAIKQYNVMNIVPYIVDPSILTIKLSGYVNYKESLQNISAAGIVAATTDALLLYNTDSLQRFGNSFSYSKSLSYVDTASSAITNSFLRVDIITPIVVLSTAQFSWDINFANQLRPGGITSDPFILSVGANSNTLYYFEDDSKGNIVIYGIINGDATTKFYVGNTYGTINYTNGKVSLTNLELIPYLDPYNIFVSAEPMSYDVKPAYNQILTLSRNQIIIDAIPVN